MRILIAHLLIAHLLIAHILISRLLITRLLIKRLFSAYLLSAYYRSLVLSRPIESSADQQELYTPRSALHASLDKLRHR